MKYNFSCLYRFHMPWVQWECGNIRFTRKDVWRKFPYWRFDAMYCRRKLHFGGNFCLHLQGGPLGRVLRLSHREYALTIFTTLIAKIVLVCDISGNLSASIFRVWRDEWWKFRDNFTACHVDLRLDIWLLCLELKSRLLGRISSANR